MSYEPFKSAVQSGVGWLGDIPSHWEVVPAKALFSLRTEKALPDDIHLTPSQKYGVLPQVEYMEITGNRVVLNLMDSGQMKHVEPNDFVSHLRSFQGGLELSRIRGKVSGAYTVLKLRKDQNPDFWKYALKSDTYIQALQTTTDQLRDGQSIRLKEFAQIPLPLLPRTEQDAIVNFLDRELEQIDALIAKNEELVTNLLERRKALITSLVTFGSASSRSVPKNWIPQRLRHLATIESGRDYKEVEVFEGGYPIYGSGGEFGRAGRYLYSGESVLLGRKGTIDRPLYVNEAFWTVDTMYWTRFKPGVCIKFMYYWATTIPFKMYSTNTALPSMTGADLKNMSINLPPLDEQISIAAELDQAIEGMDILQRNSEKSVQLLSERRQALIASAVTGKLELQEAS
jgi:type I restriction enzyme, S subunit